MQFKLFSFAALAAVTSAQKLSAVLAATPELSQLISVSSQYPDLIKALSSAKDITILAPNNAAFEKYLTPATLKAVQTYPKIFEAVLTYHVLRATVPASSFKTAPAFIPTLLDTPVLTNVTGGQVVEGFVKGKDIEIVSGLRNISTVVKGVSILSVWEGKCLISKGYQIRRRLDPHHRHGVNNSKINLRNCHSRGIDGRCGCLSGDRLSADN